MRRVGEERKGEERRGNRKERRGEEKRVLVTGGVTSESRQEECFQQEKSEAYVHTNREKRQEKTVKCQIQVCMS